MINRNKCAFLVISMLLFCTIGFCGNYKVYEKDVTWNNVLTMADPDTFVELDSDLYGKDEHRVYFAGKPIWGSDPSSFSILEGLYSKDKIGVYHAEVVISGLNQEMIKLIPSEDGVINFITDGKNIFFRDQKVEGVLLDQFIPLKNGYAIGNKNIYYGSKKIENAEKSSFVTLGFNYASDKYSVFYNGNTIESVKPADFRVIGHFAAVDRGNNFYQYGIKNGKKIDFKNAVILNDEFATDGNVLIRLNGFSTPKEVDVKSVEVLLHPYYKDKNRAYFMSQEIIGADSATFRVINKNYSVDKNQLFRIVSPINGVDVKTLEFLSGEYYKTADRVYYSEKIVDGANPGHFQVFENDEYGKDEKNVFYLDKILVGAKPNEFRILKSGISISEGNFYKQGELQPHIDGRTFQFLKNGYRKDKKNVYYFDDIVEGASNNSFEPLGFGYGKDEMSVYYKGSKIEGAESKTFKPVGGRYAQDKNSIYYDGEFLEKSIETGQIEVLSNSRYIKSKKGIYLDGIHFGMIDSETVKLFGNHYIGDKSGVYFITFRDQLIKLLDAETTTFSQVYSPSGSTIYGKDGKRVYLADQEIEGADPVTFVPLLSLFSKDKKYVFWRGEIIKGADPQTFRIAISNEDYAEDKNYVYQGGIRIGKAKSVKLRFFP